MNEIIKSIKKTKLKKFFKPNPRKDYPPTYRPMYQNNKLSKKLENKVTVLLQGKKTKNKKPRIKIFENPEILSDHFEDLITQLNCIDYSKSLCKLKNKHKEGTFFKSNLSNSKSEPLQHEASTSQEKGTMTDSFISKKLKEYSGSDESSVVLQNISVNKSEGRDLLRISSKPSVDSLHKLDKFKEKKLSINVDSATALINIEDFHNSDTELICHQKLSNWPTSDISICNTNEKDNVSDVFTKEHFSGFDGESEEIRQHGPIRTHDFKGFTNASSPDFNHANGDSYTSDSNVDGLDIEKLRNKCAPTDLDHPYSYCTLDPKSNSTSVQGKPPDKDFPNFPFMSRSVFGSPSSSKNPPDILLHNDKINILRQMSHVFNDERNKVNPNDGTKEVLNHSKSGCVNLNFSKAIKMSNSLDSKAAKVTNLENKVNLEKNINDANKDKDESNLAKDVLNSPISGIVSEKAVLKLPIKNNGNKESHAKNELISPMSIYGTAATDKAVPVYLVSSHSLDKGESIKVKSYVGQRGEHVDIIDGFAFASFNTLCEMNSYKDKRVLKRRKKRRRLRSKIVEREYKSSGITDFTEALKNEFVKSLNSEKITCETSSINLLEPDMHCSNSLERDNEECKMKEAVVKNKNLSGAFASNDLDNYLDSHSSLNICFPPPICSTSTRNIINEINEDNLAKEQQLKESLKDIDNAADLYVNKLENEECSVSSIDKVKEILPSSIVDNKLNLEVKDQPVEIIYVYHSGRLLTLAGSLTKVNPSTPQNVKARVALPRGHQSLIEHSHKVSARKIKVVEINEDMAKFAVSALKAPFKIDVEPSTNSAANQKVTKKNILDILTAKLAIDETCDLELEKSQSKNDEEVDLGLCPDKLGSLDLRSQNLNHCDKAFPTPSKVKWNQDDILKKSLYARSSEQSTALSKNIKRFPSLSREMKRLNMNYIQCKNKSENEDSNEENVEQACSNKFCELGCVCDSLRCQKRFQEHCGDPSCMFSCHCEKDNWRKSMSLSNFSIFNIDQHQKSFLAVKEKDFKNTVIQNGSEVFVLDGKKKKRDIKLPERFRDSTLWTADLYNYEKNEEANIKFDNKDVGVKYGSEYKSFTKPFCLDVPWYNIEGVSAWCMVHSCYDCKCLYEANTSKDSFEKNRLLTSTLNESQCLNKDHIEAADNAVKPLCLLSDSFKNPNSSLAKCKIIHFDIFFNEMDTKSMPGVPTGKWILKHWIHNADLHCSRTCGYELKNVIKKKVNRPLHQGYSLPPPKHPFIMGKTLKSSKSSGLSNKKNLLPKGLNFYDGLGSEIPSLDSPLSVIENNIISETNKLNSAPQTDLTSVAEDSYYFNSLNYVEKSALPSNISSVESCVSNIKEDSLKLPVDSSSTVNHSKNDNKQQSLFEMIKEEEKRGELELDLANTFLEKKILITESRFRKLINMNIIGIIGLNRQGRCIIGSVKSADDLIKMQKIQLLISNNSIDVGPNMKEIFSPTNQAEGQKVRYVMINYNQFANWEIIGIVQRKAESETINHKSKKPKLIPKNSTAEVKLNPVSSTFKLPNATETLSNLNIEKYCKSFVIGPNSLNDASQIESSYLATAENIDSEKDKYAKVPISNTLFPSKTYHLNQSSEKVFGYDSDSFLKQTSLPKITLNSSNASLLLKPMETQCFKSNEQALLSAPNIQKISQQKEKQITNPSSCKPLIHLPNSSVKPHILGLGNTKNPKLTNKLDVKRVQTLTSNISQSKGMPFIVKTSTLSQGSSKLNNFSAPSETSTGLSTPQSHLHESDLEHRDSPMIKDSNKFFISNVVSIDDNYTNLSKNVTCGKRESSPVSQHHLVSSGSPAHSNLMQASSGSILPSPDIKCLAVKSNENCTAVDLTINFKSIKLHWILGNIKRQMLLHIYNVSKKNNGPVSLFGRNERMRITFFGMHKLCNSTTSQLTDIPVLILGSKVSFVLEAAKLQEKELFRSNTIKYVMKDETGYLNSYSYDSKGKNLIRISSRLRKVDGSFPKKVSVQEMREFAVKSATIKESNMNPPEEIIIDSDSDEEITKNQNNILPYSEFSKTLYSKSSFNSRKVAEDMSDSLCKKSCSEDASTQIGVHETNSDEVGYTDISTFGFSSTDSTPGCINSLQNDVEKQKTLQKTVLKGVMLLEEDNSQNSEKLLVMDDVDDSDKCGIENYYVDSEIAENSDSYFDKISGHFTEAVVDEDSCFNDTNSVKKIVEKSIYCLTKKRKFENINHNVHNTVNLVGDMFPAMEVNHKEEGEPCKNDNSSANNVDMSKLLFKDGCSSGLNEAKDKRNSLIIVDGNVNQSVVESNCINTNMAWLNNSPTKILSNSLEYSSNNSVNTPSKPNCNISNYQSNHSPLNKREKISNIQIFGQEFQQIFSEAPQFWAMDTVERHNALERIRRKGLSKMFFNLFEAVNGPSKEKKLPPKHNVLRNAETVIQELKLKDTRLNQEEIQLRSERMNLLNVFADLLKDMDEEVQKQMELWISQNISNPTSKEDFERSWKPSVIIFEDEPIKSSTVGDITLKGSEITSYFEAHTSGINTATCSPKSSPNKKKFIKRFPLYNSRSPGKIKLGGFINLKRVSPKKLLKDERKTMSNPSIESGFELQVKQIVSSPIKSNLDKNVALKCLDGSSLTNEESKLSFHPL